MVIAIVSVIIVVQLMTKQVVVPEAVALYEGFVINELLD